MIIAIDFDGTIVEHKYPEIGREIPFAIETLKRLQADRHKLILDSVDCARRQAIGRGDRVLPRTWTGVLCHKP